MGYLFLRCPWRLYRTVIWGAWSGEVGSRRKCGEGMFPVHAGKMFTWPLGKPMQELSIDPVVLIKVNE